MAPAAKAMRTSLMKAKNSVAFNSSDHDAGLSRFSIDSMSMAEISSDPGDSGSTPSHLLPMANRDTFTKQETKAVNSVKMVVYLILFLSAVGFAVGTYFLVQQEQSQSYKSGFYSLSEVVAMDVDLKIRGILTQLQTTSSSITSQSLSNGINNDKKVTVPQFDQRMRDFLNSTELIMYAPLILEAEIRDWETYSVREQGWIDEALENRGWTAETTSIVENIQFITASRTQESYAPLWQMSPVPPDRSIINTDLFSHPGIASTLRNLTTSNNSTTMSGIVSVDGFLKFVPDYEESDGPTSILAVPVYGSFTDPTTIIGYVLGIFAWDVILDVPSFKNAVEPIFMEIKQSCGGPAFSYQANKDAMTYLGTNVASTMDLQEEHPIFDACGYSLTMGTTEAFVDSYANTAPLVSAILVFVLFAFIMSIFFIYDFIVQQRQKKLLMTAQRTNAVVSSLFPEDVQRRIMAEAEAQEKKEQRMTVTNKMKEFLQDTAQPTSKGDKAAELRGKPIADFFPEATVMFADLVGFTAWSSMREPTQVFTLLESIYNSFDEIARRRRVFKVETVGDCYVAVSGLPDPCVDHALVMARFASDCRIRMNDLVKELEVMLGPDTTELAMRFGLHSGPVTAGVLRGDKARFQLFGDTINTTSRIESTGKRDRIHISQETAEYLITAGKQHWLKLREDRVTAKGKGELTTYWLAINKLRTAGKALSTSSHSSGWSISDSNLDINNTSQSNFRSSLTEEPAERLTEKHRRLVNWITNELADILRQLEVSRIGRPESKSLVSLEQLSISKTAGQNPLDEVEEIITLPKYSAASREFSDELERENFMLPKFVIDELRAYVSTLAGMYLENPFHNFEHASHVTMSVVKLMSRIVAPNIQIEDDDFEAALHDKTYGITSDPLTQFAVVLSALIHDVDHPGVPNSQLSKEETQLASMYRDKSVAEQNSVDLAWTLLMEGNFRNLRQCIYRTEAEFHRFRKLVVNTVLATDIMDKELGGLRKERWNKAFSEEIVEDQMTAVNRKATIVIEHIIQASDIAHTMQHWHIYRKWNSRLFEELYKAYTEGRAEKNPAQNWYEGELGFFDFYIIPLAKKLKDCGVFGVSSDEYLNYALQNRREWELHGETVVASMIETIRMKTSQNYRKPVEKPDGGKSINIEKLRLREIPNEISTVPITDLPPNMHVLFADDSLVSSKSFGRGISRVAPTWKVKFANSGEKAVEIATNSDVDFDLIFLDQYFVNGGEEHCMLGTEAVTQLRHEGIHSRICGMSANDHENLFDEAGANSFTFKPLALKNDALKLELLRILNGDELDLA